MTKDYYINKLFSKREIKPSPDGRFPDCWWWTGGIAYGYGNISLVYNGKYTKTNVHRLSSYLFKDFDLNSKDFICHHCDNKLCFNPNHLYIGNQETNMRDMVERNRVKSPMRKVDFQGAIEITDLYCSGRFTMKEIGKIYGLHRTNIGKIVNGKTY